VAGLEIELNVSAHWILVKDDPGVGDWYLEFTGEKSDAPHVLAFDCLVDRAAGTGFIEMGFEIDVGGVDTWAPIATTTRPLENTNTAQKLTGTGDASFNRGDRIRLASENLVDAVDARIYQVNITGSGS
jgi:hypothetical protein